MSDERPTQPVPKFKIGDKVIVRKRDGLNDFSYESKITSVIILPSSVEYTTLNSCGRASDTIVSEQVVMLPDEWREAVMNDLSKLLGETARKRWPMEG